MGILFMNIVAFAMPEAAYSNPYAYGSRSGTDFVLWSINAVLIDGKMRGLFSFLFGASMLLVIERANAKGENAALVHYSRMVWLFVFGIGHLVLLWWGDILNHYALIGMVAWFFRKLPAYKLIVIALLLLAFEFVLVFTIGHDIAANEALVHTGHASRDALTMYISNRDHLGIPPHAVIVHDLVIHRSDYATIFAHRLPEALRAPGQSLAFLGAETLAYMLLGMAGLRSGLLTGQLSKSVYARVAAIGFVITIPAYILASLIPIRHGFDSASVAASVFVWSEPIRPIMVVAWACLIALLVRHNGWLTNRIAAAGRMAFTNYLASTVICTSLFYGYGLGLYGRLARAELYLVVIAICALMLLWSQPWLARFGYGPMEWLWRSLARRRWQPMVKNANASQ